MITNLNTTNQNFISKIESFFEGIFLPELEGHSRKDSSYSLNRSNFFNLESPSFTNPFQNLNYKEAFSHLASLGLVGAFLLRNTLLGRLMGFASAFLLAGCEGGKVYDTSTDTTTISDNLASADAILIGEEENNAAGISVANAGDVNGDGDDDILIGATGADSSKGATYMVHGPVSGTMDLSDANAKLTGDLEDDEFGVIATSAGDIDTDGYADLIVGAPDTFVYGSDYDDIAVGPGSVYIAYGPVSGSEGFSESDARLNGETDADAVGYGIANAGDINDDGYLDQIVGAPNAKDHLGVAYVVYGPVNGTSSVSAVDVTWAGEAKDSGAGASVDGADDMDGDGYPDLYIASPIVDGGAGAVYVIEGPVVSPGTNSLSDSDAKLIGEPESVLGVGIFSGDMNGDGYADLLIGAPGAGETVDSDGVTILGYGVAYLVSGPVSGDLNIAVADARFIGQYQDNAGHSVSGAGDINSDGFIDLLIGTNRPYFVGDVIEDRVYLVNGPTSGVLDLADADVEFDGPGVGLASSIAGMGDTNKDGYDDIIIGASSYNNYTGQVFLILGGD